MPSFKKGQIPWNKGIPRTEAEKKKISDNVKLAYKEGRLKPTNGFKKGMTPHNKGKTKEDYSPLMKSSKTLTGRNVTWNDKIKESHWSKKECREEVLAKMHTPEANKKRFESLMENFGPCMDPTSYEKKISELCIEYKLPFVYSGDGSFWITYGNLHKNPDFISEEKHIAIEVYHSFYKIKAFGSIEKYKEYCESIYRERGWRVLFLDENDVNVKNWKEICFNKIFVVMKNE